MRFGKVMKLGSGKEESHRNFAMEPFFYSMLGTFFVGGSRIAVRAPIG